MSPTISSGKWRPFCLWLHVLRVNDIWCRTLCGLTAVGFTRLSASSLMAECRYSILNGLSDGMTSGHLKIFSRCLSKYFEIAPYISNDSPMWYMIWSDMIRYDIWYDMIRYDTIYDMIRYDTIRYDITSHHIAVTYKFEQGYLLQMDSYLWVFHGKSYHPRTTWSPENIFSSHSRKFTKMLSYVW